MNDTPFYNPAVFAGFAPSANAAMPFNSAAATIPAAPKKNQSLVEFCESHGGTPGKISVTLDNVQDKDGNDFVSIKTKDGCCFLSFPKDNADLKFTDKEQVKRFFNANKPNLRVLTGNKGANHDGAACYTIILSTAEEFEC